MAKHGVYVSEQATSVGIPAVAESGIPFVIGVAPVQSADAPAKVGEPVLCTSFEEAKAKLGYSDAWDKYTLCEYTRLQFTAASLLSLLTCLTRNDEDTCSYR